MLLTQLTEKNEPLELRVLETKNKAGKFLYQVIGEDGTVHDERRSNRTYVAALCWKNNGHYRATYYFGRLDLVGKGESGRVLKQGKKFAALAVVEELKNQEH